MNPLTPALRTAAVAAAVMPGPWKLWRRNEISKENKHAHPNRSCMGASDNKYCREAVNGGTEIACGCGRPGCSGKVT